MHFSEGWETAPKDDAAVLGHREHLHEPLIAARVRCCGTVCHIITTRCSSRVPCSPELRMNDQADVARVLGQQEVLTCSD